ncbi:hypothetical protein GCM10010498_32250 [Streptomyces cavourensis]|nr:hypothetical protein GCM10010498_32250 [Streptomyces cavourensis]
MRRGATPTLDEHARALAKRHYNPAPRGNLLWLAPGVDPAECARRTGQSIQVLFRYYAKPRPRRVTTPTPWQRSRYGGGSRRAMRRAPDQGNALVRRPFAVSRRSPAS